MSLSGILKISRNPILIFVGSRYVGFALQIVRNLLLAKILEPYLFGVYGFLLLVLIYLSFISFGLQYAITVKISTESDNKQENDKTISVALTYTFLIALLLTLTGFAISLANINIFPKYFFKDYAAAIGLIAGLNLCWEMFKNIYRVLNKLNRIIYSELINIFVLLSVVFIFKKEALVLCTLIAMIISGIINIAIFTAKSPYKFKISLSKKHIFELTRIGIPLLVVTVSSYLITLAPRTIVSIFFDVEKMGYYSFANSITNSVMLGLNTIAWVFLPTTLAKTHNGISDEEAASSISTINNLYGTSVSLAIFGAMICLPLLFVYLPKYDPANNTLYILMLAQAAIAVSFGSNSLAVARNRQGKVAIISIISLLLVVGLSIASAKIGLSLEWIAVSVLVGSFTFTILLARTCRNLLNLGHTSIQAIGTALPFGTVLPIIVALMGSIMNYSFLGGLFALILFVSMNTNKIQFLYRFISGKARNL